MPLTCLAYACPDGTDGPCIKKPLDTDVLAPWVRITFPKMPLSQGTSGQTVGVATQSSFIDTSTRPALTVGNESNPPNNHAIIKSFQYGTSNGNGAEVEIYDEEGGEFDLFANKLVKVLSDGNDYSCAVQWGWAMADCQGGKNLGPQSSIHYFIILSVDIHYSAGGISFKLELLDLMQPLFETRKKDIIAGVTLKKAIEILFTERTTPKIKSVLFKRMTPGAGGKLNCNYLNKNSDGLKSLPIKLEDLQDLNFLGELETKKTDWHCNNLNPLAVVEEWLRDKMTDKNKGTVIFWNSTSPISQLVILESPLPLCWSELNNDCSRSLGTYIVNGGNQSPVLSFDPKIKFVFAAAARAGAGVDNSQTAKGGVSKPAKPCPENNIAKTPLGSGDETIINLNETFNRIYGPGNLVLAIRGIAAQEQANKTYENIEAELRIQGDPTLDNPYFIKVKTVSLVVINPFHLRNAGGNEIVRGEFASDCPEWLVGPPCNQILSNKNWFIDGVSHEIKEGSYTTTLKIFLPAPGQTVKP